MTYVLLSVAFLAAALVVAAFAIARRGGWLLVRRGAAPVALAALALFLLTAVFDNVLIALGVMVYADDATSGIRVVLAPIEDFAYPLAAVILLPAVWVLLRPGGGAADDGD